MTRLATEPTSIGKVLDAGFKLFFAGLGRVILLSLTASLIGVAPALMYGDIGTSETLPSGAALVSMVAITLITILLNMVLLAAVLYRLGRLAEEREMTLREALAQGLRCLLPMIFATILYTLAIVLGLVALVIPGLILMLSLAFFAVAIVLDEEGPLSALKRSHRLVWGNWWRTATVLSVPVIVLIGLQVALGLAVGIPVGVLAGGSKGMLTLLSQGVQVLTNTFSVPLLYAIFVVQYHDLKLRKEGSDLEARLAAVG